MLKSGIADTYRYEQFIKKPDVLYNIDHLIYQVNLNSLDKNKVEERLVFLQLLFFVSVLNLFCGIEYSRE